MRKRDDRVGHLGDAASGLQRTIAATDHQNMSTAILFRIDQAIDHFALFFAWHTERARSTTTTDRQKHRVGSIDRARSLNFEILSDGDDRFDAFPEIDLETRFLRNIFEELHQFFFAEFLEVELSSQWQVNGAVITNFPRGKWATVPPRLSCSTVTNRRFVFDCCEASRKAGRSTADDEKIEDVGPSDAPQLAYGADRLTPLFDSVAHESHATQLAGDEDAGNICLKVLIDVRNVHSSTFSSENERDGIDGQAVLQAPCPMQCEGSTKLGFAVNQSQDFAFGAGSHAGAAAETFRRINGRMKGGGLKQSGLS